MTQQHKSVAIIHTFFSILRLPSACPHVVSAFQVVERVLALRNAPNTLAEEAEEKQWNLVRRPWIPRTSESVPDFSKMSERDLEIFFTRSYQLPQSVSYLAEILREDNSIAVNIHRDDSNVLKFEVPSRHIKRTTYRCFVDYMPISAEQAGKIRRYSCECANGKRTAGCCSHAAAVVFYVPFSCAASRLHHQTRADPLFVVRR